MDNYEMYAEDDIVLLMSNLGDSGKNFISKKEEAYKLGFCGFQDNDLVKETSINNSEQYRLTEEALDKLYLFYKQGILLNDVNINSIPDVVICPAGLDVKDEILEFLSRDDVPISFIRLSTNIASNDYTLNPNDPNYLRDIEEIAYYNKLEKNKIVAKNCALAIEKEAEKKFGNDEAKKEEYIIEQLKEMYKKKDMVTYNHICGMIDLIPIVQAGLPEELKLTENETRNLYNMVVLHDLGKLTIPNQILDKPGKLTPSEISKMHAHVLMENASIINNACLQELLKRALMHHKKANLDDERVDLDIYYSPKEDDNNKKAVGMDNVEFGYWDSNSLGNPRQEKLDSILPILDVYNALTATDRPYRKPFSSQDAVGNLFRKNDNGTIDFDEQYLRYFVDGLDKTGILDKSSLKFENNVIEDGGKRL